MKKIFLNCFICCLAMLWVAVHAAEAHKISIYGWAEGEKILTRSKFSNGKPVKSGNIHVYDAHENLLIKGITDKNGAFSFRPPQNTGLKIVLETGEGHTAEWVILKQEVDACRETSPKSLDTVVVKAGRIEERLSAELGDLGHPVEIITGESIAQAGFADLNQALNAFVPGLFISVKGGRGDYAGARLHGGEQILWLLDGVRLNNRLYGSGYLDTISVKMIEKIEILKGGEGVFYGTDAASGVINIITKPVTHESSGRLAGGFGSHGFKEVSGHVSDSFKGHGVLFFANHEGWDGYRLYTENARDSAGNSGDMKHGYDRTTLGMKYRKDIFENATFRAHLQRNEGTFDFSELHESSAFNERTENIGFLKWDHDVSDKVSYYVKSYFHSWWTAHTRKNPDGSYINHASEWGYEDWGMNLMGSYRFPEGHEILFGGDYQCYRAEDDVWHIRDKQENVYAAFAEYRPCFSFSPRTRIAIGGRCNRTGEYDKTIYHASIRTPLIRDTYVRLLIGTSFRLPTAEQLYLDEENAWGNPDLVPEESFNADIGVGGKWSLLAWEVAWFYRSISDKIGLIPYDEYGISGVSYENTEGETEIEGAEFIIGIGPVRGVSLGGSTTVLEIHEKKGSSEQSSSQETTTRHHGTTHEDTDTGTGSDSGSTDIATGDTPEFTAKGVISYRNSPGTVGVDISLSYIGNTYSRYDGRINYGRYAIFDLAGFVSFGKDRKHTMTCRMENILDEDYAPDVGRSENAQTGDFFYYKYKGMPFSLVAGYSYTF